VKSNSAAVSADKLKEVLSKSANQKLAERVGFFEAIS
jgi:hypothetical protein